MNPVLSELTPGMIRRRWLLAVDTASCLRWLWELSRSARCWWKTEVKFEAEVVNG